MAAVRRLDRSRSYGEILPREGREAFVQDHMIFDYVGDFIRHDGAAPPPQEESDTEASGPLTGAVSLSGGGDAPAAPPPPPPTGLQPQPLDVWQTMPFPELRKKIATAFGQAPPNKVAALNLLRGKNLITE